jgi:hypothetical protein
MPGDPKAERPGPHTPLPDATASPSVAAPAAFTRTWSTHGIDAAVMRISGELYVASSPPLEQTLGEAQRVTWVVVLDPRELGFSRVRICPPPVALGLHSRRTEPRPPAIRDAFVLRHHSSRRSPCRCEPANRSAPSKNEWRAPRSLHIRTLSRDPPTSRRPRAAGRAM